MFKSFAPHMTDSYKLGHIYQYPAGTEQVYTNWTPRSDRLLPVLRNTLDGFKPFEGRMVWFGLQAHLRAFLIDAWNESFFDIPRDKAVARSRTVSASSGAVGSAGPMTQRTENG